MEGQTLVIVAKLLLAAGADVSAQDDEGNTPLDVFIDSEYISKDKSELDPMDCIIALILVDPCRRKKFIEMDSTGMSIEELKKKIEEDIEQEYSSNSILYFNNFPIYMRRAQELGRFPGVSLSVAGPDKKNEKGETKLDRVTKFKSTYMAKLLLRYGFCTATALDQQNKQRRNPGI